MKMKSLLYIALSTVLVTGCATTSDVKLLQRKIYSLNNKLEQIENTTVDQLHKKQAIASNHLDQLEQDITQLRAQIEESYYLNQRLREQNQQLQAAISNVAQQESVKREEALQALLAEQKIKEEKFQRMLQQQQENVKAIQTARVRDMERKAKEAALEAQMAQQRKEALTKSGRKQQAKTIYATQKKVRKSPAEEAMIPATRPQPTTKPAPEKKTEKHPPVAPIPPTSDSSSPASLQAAPATPAVMQINSQLAEGKRLMAQKRYQQAFQIFEKISMDGTSAERISARFMMGECQFAMKQYDLAAVHYQAVVAKSPKDRMAPQALIRQAQAFEKMADKETAKLIYSKIVKRYGDSPQATEAEKKLSTL